MIKIEFEEAQNTSIGLCKFVIVDKSFLVTMRKVIKDIYTPYPDVRAVFPYIPTQDPMLDREHILTQLGITKEQDEANQIEWRKL